MCVVDLPGVADAENTGTESNFTEMTLKWAAECDVVVWVTDVRTCFLTTHEKLEYEKLKATTMRDVAQREGRLFQFCVVLTKCDVEVTKTGSAGASASAASTGASAQRAKGALSALYRAPQIKKGEIVSEHEETTVYDCILRAKRMFPDDHMIPFNAFGRILTRNDASETLKALAARLAPGAGKHNIQLDMKWATEDLHERRQAQMLRSILWHLGPTEAEYNEDKVDAMKAHLDEDSTAALVLAVLGVKDSVHPKEWHRAIVEAIEPYANARDTHDGHHKLNARALGVLQHAPAAAAKYERDIRARYESSADSRKADFVTDMFCLCGPSCIVTTRMYLLLPFGASLRLVPPRAMSSVQHGALFELDVQYSKNRAISAKKSWVEKVRAARVSLWGTDAESDVCVDTAIALTASEVLCSVLARID
ncbi:MAG: hypothetical protein EBZ40_12450 [Gammaproteobacteria bacterium]|nr:hypothetical protein [Gammaproteobacteria bacterium]